MTLAIGIGVMLMTTLLTVQHTLLDLIEDQIPTNAPSFFFIDIQPDQYASFKQMLEQHIPNAPYDLVPVVRSRLTAIDGRPINPEEHKGKRNGWYFTREYVVTTFETLPKDNLLTQGTMVGKHPTPKLFGRLQSPEQPASGIGRRRRRQKFRSVGRILTYAKHSRSSLCGKSQQSSKSRLGLFFHEFFYDRGTRLA